MRRGIELIKMITTDLEFLIIWGFENNNDYEDVSEDESEFSVLARNQSESKSDNGFACRMTSDPRQIGTGPPVIFHYQPWYQVLMLLYT
jgi:hypothetical protein